MLLSENDLVKLLGIERHAIQALVSLGKIPYKGIMAAGSDSIRFCRDDINMWLKAGLNLEMDDAYLEKYRESLLAEFPEAMNAISEFGKKFYRRSPKRYYLIKEPSKKIDFVYYVKYLDKGKLVPSRWSSGTNDEEAAAAWAVENRERLLAEYYTKKAKRPADLYKILEKYYEADSPFLIADAKRGRVLGEKKRKIDDMFIKKRFIPFLKKSNVKIVEDIDTALLARFQNYLLLTVKPQSVNAYLASVKMIFRHFITTGYVKYNPCAGLPPIKVKDIKATGCYELDKVKGIFNEQWKNRRHYLLILLIYTTGMRNSEINRIQTSDIIEICGEKFIDISKSKTPNGERVVPLHPFVYNAIVDNYGKEADYIFPQKSDSFERLCARANLSLAERTGYTLEMLKKENIVFYSGRHFWKTLMSREGLGDDIEEVFMGHKVSGDIAKRYNRKDKWGSEKLAEKAREVFAVLDRCLFAQSSENSQ